MSSAAAVSSRKVVVVGASGLVSPPTVDFLSALIGADKITVVARNPGSAKAAAYKSKGVNVVEGNYNSKESLVRPFTGASAVFLITPGCEDRAALMANAVDAAKTARVPYLLFLSMPVAGESSTLFGRQFGEIEETVKASGIPYGILRVPLYTEILLTQAEEVKTLNQIRCPLEGTNEFTDVAACDVAEAAANILANPRSHANKTYTLTAPPITFEQQVAAFSKVLGRRISFHRMSYEETKADFTRKGWPEWKTRGVLECARAIDAGRFLFKSDLRSLLGREGTGIEEWVEANKSSFM